MAENRAFQIVGAPTCRLAYVDGCFEKKAIDEKSDPKYSCILLVPYSDKEKIEQVRKAYAESFQRLKGLGFKPSKPELIGDKNRGMYEGEYKAEKTGNDVFRDYLILQISSKKYPPRIFDRKKLRITNGREFPNLNVEDISPEELESGDYVFANISFWEYCDTGYQGIGVNLNAAIRIRGGDPIGGLSDKVEDYIDADLSQYE